MVAQIDKAYIEFSKIKVLRRLIGYLFFEGRPITSRGRWINPILFFTFYLYKRIGFKKDIVKPIFIVGIGRSGSRTDQKTPAAVLPGVVGHPLHEQRQVRPRHPDSRVCP